MNLHRRRGEISTYFILVMLALIGIAPFLNTVLNQQPQTLNTHAQACTFDSGNDVPLGSTETNKNNMENRWPISSNKHEYDFFSYFQRATLAEAQTSKMPVIAQDAYLTMQNAPGGTTDEKVRGMLGKMFGYKPNKLTDAYFMKYKDSTLQGADTLVKGEAPALLVPINPGDPVKMPATDYDIGGGKEAMVVFAANDRITLHMSRAEYIRGSGENNCNGGPCSGGYWIYIRGICVDQQIVNKYNSIEAAQKSAGANKNTIQLPMIDPGRILGKAASTAVEVIVRDNGPLISIHKPFYWEGVPSKNFDTPPTAPIGGSTNTPVPPPGATATPTNIPATPTSTTSPLSTWTPTPSPNGPTPIRNICKNLEINGNERDKYDLVFLSSGYTDYDSFETDAKKAVQAIKNTNLGSTILNKFNFKLHTQLSGLFELDHCSNIDPSNSSDWPCWDRPQAGYASLRCNGDGYLIIIHTAKFPESTTQAKEDIKKWGGGLLGLSYGPGHASVFRYVFDSAPFRDPWENTVPHELGHSIGLLHDEYITANIAPATYVAPLNCSENPSTSRSESSACPKWETDFPTVGCYGGCYYTNWFRSSQYSIMGDDFDPNRDGGYLHKTFNAPSLKMWEEAMKNFL